MNDFPKIQLSPFEEQLVSNSDWLLTKNAILEKIKGLFSAIASHQQHLLSANGKALPPEVLQTPPKITRGENYLGLPWLVLDQPRFFDKQDIFAIRTMFWWGNFFSVTLQLSGIYHDRFLASINNSYQALRKKDFHIGCSNTQWDHHFGEQNYSLISDFDERSFSRHTGTHPFIKLARRTQIENGEIPGQGLIDSFKTILEVFNR